MLASGKIHGLAVIVLGGGLSTLLSATPPNVVYTAAGAFASPPLSGADLLKLAGEPFTFSVMANTAMAPASYGTYYATYTPLKFSGTFYSGLIPGTPVAVTGQHAFLNLNELNPNYDQLVVSFQVKVLDIPLKITATVNMPKGTLVNLHIHPFSAPVTLSASNTSAIYADPDASTTLGMTGTASTSILPAPPATAAFRPENAGPDFVIKDAAVLPANAQAG
jgi:hypothetical protein